MSGFYGGFLGNVGGLQAGANPLLNPNFKIKGGEPWNKTPVLPGKDTKDMEREINIPTNTQSNLLAQALPGQMAGMLGGPMQMNPNQGPNVFSVRPRVSYLEPEQGGLDLGGSINIPLGQTGRIGVQGGYQPENNMLNLQGTIGQPQGAQGFGVDFFVNRKLGNRRPNPMEMPMGGMGMNDMGGQLRYGTEF
jgi:hypothetical protein